MKNKKQFLILLAGMLILALVAAGCQSSQKPEGPPDGEYSNSGYLWTLEQGHYNVQGFEAGSYTIDGDKITFNAQTFSAHAQYLCGKFPVYTYQWTFDAKANQLTFKTVDDPCWNRQDVNTTGHWVYSKVSN